MEEKLEKLYKECIDELEKIDIHILDEKTYGKIDINLSNKSLISLSFQSLVFVSFNTTSPFLFKIYVVGKTFGNILLEIGLFGS